MEEIQIDQEPLTPPEPEISCRHCGAEPKARELLNWYQRGLFWSRSTREQLLCGPCFELLDESEKREWIPVADMVVD